MSIFIYTVKERTYTDDQIRDLAVSKTLEKELLLFDGVIHLYEKVEKTNIFIPLIYSSSEICIIVKGVKLEY